MNSKNLIIVMALAAIGLLAVNGCKLSVGDYQEKTNATEMRYMNENGDFRMPDNGDDARLAMDGLTFSITASSIFMLYVHIPLLLLFSGAKIALFHQTTKLFAIFHTQPSTLPPR